jgi:FlaA1/EpsC-like NDP-sugar epimerase
VRDQDHPDGDIAIEFIGLRDGEKMYEELLLGQDVVGTEHPRIRRSREPFLPRHAFETVLADILASMADGGIEAIRDALGRVVENYRPEPRVRARKAPEAA